MGSRIARRALSLSLIGVMMCANSVAEGATTWPPKGFRASGDVYAKIPNAKELTAILSVSKTLAAQSKTCIKYACGVVQVASRIGCTWWEVNSTVSGPKSAKDSTRTPLGKLRVTYPATVPKKIVTIYLRSKEPLKPKITVNGIIISCYHAPTNEKIPTTTYKRVPKPKASPTPTVSPTPLASLSSEATETPSPTLRQVDQRKLAISSRNPELIADFLISSSSQNK